MIRKQRKGQKALAKYLCLHASEPEKKKALKRTLRDDSNRYSDSSLVRKKPSKPKREKNLNEFTSSEPARKRAHKALNKKCHPKGKFWKTRTHVVTKFPQKSS